MTKHLRSIEPLVGGWGQDNLPERLGKVVHRDQSDHSKYVHQVLVLLEKAGFAFAPRFLGIDDKNREMIAYIDGYVPHGQDVPPETWSLTTMQAIFEQIRTLHDLTAGTALARGCECVCHGDLSYANTVYSEGRAVAFIDWDLAHPGTRLEDVAYALLEYLSIGEYEGDGVEGRANLARALADAYGVSQGEKQEVFDLMLKQLMQTREKQLASARQGRPSGQRLVRAGVPERLLRRYKWLQHNEVTWQEVFRA